MARWRAAWRRGLGWLVVALGLVAGCGEEREVPAARLSVADSLGTESAGSLEGYERASEVRPFTFPTDHGAHPDFRTEWWYFTGNLEGDDGRRFGYQLTFFRTAVAPPEPWEPWERPRQRGEKIDEGREGEAPGSAEPAGQEVSAASESAGRSRADEAGDSGAPDERSGAAPAAGSSWRTRQVYMAHFAVTDAEGERFLAAERFARGAAGLAGAEVEPFRVWTGAWSAETVEYAGADEDIFPLRLRAATDEARIDLVLDAGGWVAQGDRGLSRKGSDETAPGEGDASYYYSFPRLPTQGTLNVGGESFRVAGDSWLDREWSTSLLAEGQIGWDWFSLQLDDGKSVVAFRIRQEDDTFDAIDGAPLGYAALVPGSPPGGTAADRLPLRRLPLRLLDAAAARLRPTGTWTSPDSGITWPSGWRLTFPDAGLDLTLEPILDDQELDLAFRYWEGAVRVEGTAAGSPVTGHGYAELTGYGESHALTR